MEPNLDLIMAAKFWLAIPWFSKNNNEHEVYHKSINGGLIVPSCPGFSIGFIYEDIPSNLNGCGSLAGFQNIDRVRSLYCSVKQLNLQTRELITKVIPIIAKS